MSTFVERVKNEPVLIVSAVLAVAALFGKDLAEYGSFIESAVVVIAGFVSRAFVSPVRSL